MYATCMHMYVYILYNVATAMRTCTRVSRNSMTVLGDLDCGIMFLIFLLQFGQCVKISIQCLTSYDLCCELTQNWLQIPLPYRVLSDPSCTPLRRRGTLVFLTGCTDAILEFLVYCMGVMSTCVFVHGNIFIWCGIGFPPGRQVTFPGISSMCVLKREREREKESVRGEGMCI